MFKDMEEVTDKDIYQKVMASDTPAILIVTSPTNPKNQEFYEAVSKYIKLYGDKVGFYYLDTTKNDSQQDFGLWAEPSVLCFAETMEMDRFENPPTEEQLQASINRMLRIK
jgi:thioredoxin 1